MLDHGLPWLVKMSGILQAEFLAVEVEGTPYESRQLILRNSARKAQLRHLA